MSSIKPPKSAGASSTNEKLDLLKLHKADYVAPKKPVLLEINSGLYLAIEGKGKPGGEEYQSRLSALFAVAFTVKMTRKYERRGEYTIGKLEARYLNASTIATPSMEDWSWQFLIRTPGFVNRADLAAAVAALRKRGKEGDAALVHLETLQEGNCVQMLHVGAYADEPNTVAVMERFARDQGMELCGAHHEIYLSDPRLVEPAKLKTIIRIPVWKTV